MSENSNRIIADKKFKSIYHAFAIAKKVATANDDELFDQAMRFINLEYILILSTANQINKANNAYEKKDWATFGKCMENAFCLMPLTIVATCEIATMNEAIFILHTLQNRWDVDITDEGSAANLLAKKALDFAWENGDHEIRNAILKGANPQLYEVINSPLGITDDGFKVIDVEDCAKALGIPVDEYLEMLNDSDFLPEGVRVNPIH